MGRAALLAAFVLWFLPQSVRAAQNPEPSATVQVTPRFVVDVEIDGDLRPNTPLTVTVTGKANFPTAEAEVSAVLPDLEAARLVGWQPHQLPVGETLPKAGVSRLLLGDGGAFSETMTIHIPAPGYYELVVSVRQLSDEPRTTSDGVPIIATVHSSLWLLILEKGGVTTREFDAELIPTDRLEERGPFFSRSDVASALPALEFASRSPFSFVSSPAEMSRHTLASITFLTAYFNQDAGAWQPLPRVFLNGQLYNVVTGQVVGTWSGTTNSQGVLTLTCTAGSGVTYKGGIYTDNSDVKTERVTAGAWVGGFEGAVCGQTNSLSASLSDVSRVHTNAVLTIAQSRAIMGYSRGKLTIGLSSGATGSSYSPSNDRITISTVSDPAVWDTTGVFIVAHEYGHAMHEKALAGNAASGDCSDDGDIGHFMLGTETLKCAYSEGFADFHAAITRGVDAQYFNTILTPPLPSGGDGASIEAHVAAFLYDITDSVGDGTGTEAHDSLALSATYISQIIRTCKYDLPGGQVSWLRAVGVDHLIYCFEKQVDPAITSNPQYFTRRTVDPVGQSEQATEPNGWNPTKIRRLWLWNLYRQ